MKTLLHLAEGFSRPALEAVTQTFGVLAVRGAGKSNLGAVMAEEMYTAHLPFVVIDPVGSWWGLRSAGDGKGAGPEVPIFGGRHGDVPLERAAGPLLADLIVDQRMTCVLDVSDFSEGDKIKFLIDFGERLYRRNTEPLHLFLEEADDYCPQRPMHEQARLLRVWENIVRRGRARGLGITMITQRSAALNKNVLTQIETLFVLRTTSPQDRAAIEAWVKYQGGSPEMLATLPGLVAGEAWVWSPSWLKTFKRVRIRRRRTFDSGATPKQTKGARPPPALAEIDLSAIKERMAETITRAKLEDPEELRAELARREKRIGELQRELDRALKATKTEKIEIRTPIEDELEKLASINAKTDALLAEARALGSIVAEAMKHALGANQSAERLRSDHMRVTGSGHVPESSSAERGRKPATTKRPTNGVSNNEVGRGGLRRILIALAQCPDGLSNKQIGVRAGLSSGSGTFATYLGRARSNGWIVGDGAGRRRITDAGITALGSYDPLPTGSALLDHWLGELGNGGAMRLLRAIAEAYPQGLGRDAAAERAKLSAGSGTFATYLGKLRTLELISGSAQLRASDDLFS